MTKSSNMRRVLLAVVYILILAFLLLGVSRLLGYLNQGAERASILHLPKFERKHHAQYSLIDDGNEGNLISKESRDGFVEDYLMAWESKQRAMSYQQPEYLTDHFTLKIQKRFQNLITDQKSTGLREETIALNHQIDIKFHNLDKSLIVLEDTKVIEHRRIFHDELLIESVTDTSAYQVICLKEDGSWKIRHLHKIQAPKSSSETPDPIDSDLLKAQVPKWQGLNYYPQEYAWDAFNLDITDDTYTKDLQLIRSLGMNAVRVFIQYEDFGGPQVSEVKIKKLKKFLDFAIQFEIGVMLTLFDFYGDYSLEDWTKTDHHIIAIIEAIKNHPALIAYDIKNEPDLDFESRGKDLVLDWLTHQINLIKSMDNKHPITIGWSSANAAVNLSDKVDFVSYHYYKSKEQFLPTSEQLRKQVGLDKPIFLSEFGMTSYRGLWNPVQFSEARQANHLSSLIEQSNSANIGYLSWTLYDYPEIPTQVVGRLPWRKKYQQHYGLIDIEGNPKPSIQLFD